MAAEPPPFFAKVPAPNYPLLAELSKLFVHQEMMSLVKRYGDEDASSVRGNFHLDRGFSGSSNLKRSKKFYGIAIPVRRKVVDRNGLPLDTSTVELLDNMESLLYTIIQLYHPTGLGTGAIDNLYLDPKEETFSITGQAKGVLPQTRYMATDLKPPQNDSDSFVLDVHVDGENGKNKLTAPVGCFASYEGTKR